jgi:hypothetical protein
MTQHYGTQGCVRCGKWVKVPLDFSGFVLCKECAKKEKQK